MHDGSHGEECFGCKIRTINLSPAATPSRRNSKTPRESTNNSWEKGIPTDSRGMPYLDSNLNVIGQKRWAETERRKFETALSAEASTSKE